MNETYIFKNGYWEYVKNFDDVSYSGGRRRTFSNGYCYFCGELDNHHGYELRYNDCLFWYNNKKLL